MSESWRFKKYYNPRVLIPVGDLVDPLGSPTLVCLQPAQMLVIRNMLAYAHRRATWVDEYQTTGYLAPDNEQWDDVEAFLAELEDCLMTDCCEDILAELEAIKDAVQCICPSLADMRQQTTIANNWPELADTTDYWTWGDDEPNPTIDAQAEEAACTLAQCWYQAGLELITEVVLPCFKFSFDTLIPAAAAALAVITGAVALPAAFGIWLGAELIQELLETAYDAAETNMVNWLWTAKEDLVCAMRNQLLTGGEASAMWSTVYDDIVADAVDLSAGDKLIIRFAMGNLALSAATTAVDEESPWVDTASESGYCDGCAAPPIIGNDWVAIELSDEIGTFDLTNTPPPTGWKTWCYRFDLADRLLVGMLTELIYWNGDGNVFASSLGGCPGAFSFTGDTSNPKIEENSGILYGDFAEFDEYNCRAALDADAFMSDQFNSDQEEDGGGRWSFYTWFGGHVIFKVTHLIYKGAYWP